MEWLRFHVVHHISRIIERSNAFFHFIITKIGIVRKPLAQLIRATSTTSSTSSAAAASSSTEVGYQRPVRGNEAAPVRFGFVPEEW